MLNFRFSWQLFSKFRIIFIIHSLSLILIIAVCFQHLLIERELILGFEGHLCSTSPTLMVVLPDENNIDKIHTRTFIWVQEMRTHRITERIDIRSLANMQQTSEENHQEKREKSDAMWKLELNEGWKRMTKRNRRVFASELINWSENEWIYWVTPTPLHRVV